MKEEKNVEMKEKISDYEEQQSNKKQENEEMQLKIEYEADKQGGNEGKKQQERDRRKDIRLRRDNSEIRTKELK